MIDLTKYTHPRLITPLDKLEKEMAKLQHKDYIRIKEKSKLKKPHHHRRHLLGVHHPIGQNYHL